MPTKRDASLAVLMLISWGLLGVCVYRERANDRFEMPHGNLLGDAWLRMKPGERVYFIEGYRRGSSAGHVDACDLFSEPIKRQLPPVSTPSGILLDPCQGRTRNWSKGTEELVRQIDDFYVRFPGDRGVHVTNLIQNLSDQSGLTIEQIHALGNH